MTSYHQEEFTAEEQAVLSRFFTNLDLPVFGLINLPEVVKGALFARYSRSAKSLRRLFLDEFVADPESGIDTMARGLDDDPLVATRKAEQLYQRVFFDYGDDSVAQLGGAHLACEQASNLLTKVLEWGRLAAYLEQSTRYIRYDARLGDRYRYFVPPEITNSSHADRYLSHMEQVFDTYSTMVARTTAHFEELHPRGEDDSVMEFGMRRSGPRRATRYGACFRCRHYPTSASTAPGRLTRCPWSGCGPTRCARCSSTGR